MRMRWMSVVLAGLMLAASSLGCSTPTAKESATGASPEPAEADVHDVHDLATQASFALNVEKSNVLRLGKSELQTQSAFVEYKKELFAGSVNALKIQFFTQPISAETRMKLLRGETDELTRTGYAALVLLLDSSNQVSQVNLTYVIPGTTVMRTVASTPDELAKHFADCHFDHGRLRLKSEGAYDTGKAEDEVLSMSWKVDLDVPVVDQPER